MFKVDKAKEADRGKWAENQTQVFLEGFSAAHTAFDWERLPDSRSSMGRVAAQVADFSFFCPNRHGVIEVKTVGHKYRLARAKVPQFAKMRKRHLAGGRCIVLVYHSGLKAWRYIPVQDLDPSATSWDLSHYALYPTVASALEGFTDA